MLTASKSSNKTPATWASRVKEALNGEFKPQMFRAVILLAIFEANRIMEANKESQTLRPFQRKITILHTALDLISTLDFIPDKDKARIISITPKNQKANPKPILARMAFHRAQGLEGEIEKKILPGVEKLLEGGMSHGDVCEAFVQNLFEEVTKESGPHPPLWIFNRRPIFLIYRVYYQGMGIDSNIFEAKAPRTVDVPRTRPADLVAYVFGTWSPMEKKVKAVDDVMDGVYVPADGDGDIKSKGDDVLGGVAIEEDTPSGDGEAPILKKHRLMHHKQRMQHLMELKLRLDLLNEVGQNGGFTEEWMKKEKNKIFIALPHVVPANASKNRQLFMMETKLRLEILKDLKSSGVRPNKCNKLMKDMYLGLPALNSIEDLESTFLTVKDKKAKRMAKKAAGGAKREDGKKTTEGEADLMATDGDEGAENEWEVLDEMEEVNASVANISMTV